MQFLISFSDDFAYLTAIQFLSFPADLTHSNSGGTSGRSSKSHPESVLVNFPLDICSPSRFINHCADVGSTADYKNIHSVNMKIVNLIQSHIVESRRVDQELMQMDFILRWDHRVHLTLSSM